MSIHYKYIVITKEYKVLHHRAIQELSRSIVSTTPMEMSASPTALQDNPCRVKDSDGDWSTKEATQDRVKPITSTCYQRKLVFTSEEPADHRELQKCTTTTKARETILAPIELSQQTSGMATHFRSSIGWLHRLGPHNRHQCAPLSMSKTKLTVTKVYEILIVRILKGGDRGYILISTLLRDTHHE